MFIFVYTYATMFKLFNGIAAPNTALVNLTNRLPFNTIIHKIRYVEEVPHLEGGQFSFDH